MSIKVGIVTTSYPRRPGDAAGVFIAQLADALRERGADVRVVAPAPSDLETRDVPAGVTYAIPRLRAAREIAYGGGIVENLRRRPGLLPLLPVFLGALTRATRETLSDCDVIDACFTAAGWAVARARHEKQAVLYSAHGTDVHLMARSTPYRRALLRLLDGYDRVTATCEHLESRLRSHGYAGEIDIVPNGVADELFRMRLEWTEAPSVVYAARLLPGKRPDLLLRAWPRVVRALPGSRLHVLGDGPLRASLSGLSRSLGIEESVTLHGEVPQETVWSALARSWLCVLPSREEGLSVGLLEALALGTPFVASPCGQEIARDTGGGEILPEPLTADALGQAIERKLRDPGALATQGTKARQRARERYSWAGVAEKKLAAYERAIAASL